MNTTITDKRPRARRVHYCDLCRYDIHRGTVHVYRTGVSDGEWWTMRAHVACDRYAHAAGLCNPDYGFEEGCVAEHVLGDWPGERWVRFYCPAGTGGRWPTFRVGYAVAVAARLTMLGSEGR